MLVCATLVGITFVLPSFLMVLAMGWAYLNVGGLDWMQRAFYGVGASTSELSRSVLIDRRAKR